jgi:hypothetical protein
MWVQLINPDGDINDANNYIPDSAGSLPSWGDNWRHPDIWKAEGWRNDIPDDWQPPNQPLTKDQLTANLDAEYQPQFAELSQALGMATLANNTDLITSIKADYVALKTEYDTKRGEING